MAMPGFACEDIDIEPELVYTENYFDTDGDLEGWQGCVGSTSVVSGGNLEIDGLYNSSGDWQACALYDISSVGVINSAEQIEFVIDVTNLDFSNGKIYLGISNSPGSLSLSNPNGQILQQGINTFTITPFLLNGPLNQLVFWINEDDGNVQDYTFSISSIKVSKTEQSTINVCRPRINLDSYRYAYNGMEYDAEVKGGQNSYTTQFRQYDPRLGRWLSLDPLMAQFPSMSPYVAFDNNPVYYIDPYGLSSSVKDPEDEGEPEKKVSPKTGSTHVKNSAGEWVLDVEGGGAGAVAKKRPSWNEILTTVGGLIRKYGKDRSPGIWVSDTRKSVSDLPLGDMVAGDIYRREVYDPKGVDYTSGVFTDYQEYEYLGDGEFILTRQFKQVQTAEAITDVVLTIIPVGRVFKIVGKSIKFIRATRIAKAANIAKANRFNHIFGKAEHVLGSLVKRFGSQEKAYVAVQKAANRALKKGNLTPNAKGVLPSGDAGNIINVGGMNVRLIGGRVVDGKIVLSSFSRKGL